MSIIRKRNGNFTVINNSIFNDERLSMEALGVLTWLLSKPDNWTVIQSHISAVFKVGKDKTYRVIRELIDCGYLVRMVDRDEKGGFGGVTYILYDNPPNASISPFPENPEAVNPLSGNPPLIKTESNKNLEVGVLFDKFWQAYPDKTAKAYCFKIFSKLSVQDQQLAAQSMPAFLDWIAEKRKKFKDYSPPNPSTYLNQRRFDDYKPVEKAPIDWAKLMPILRANKTWTKPFGPPPNHPDCVVPKQYLQDGDGIGWHG